MEVEKQRIAIEEHRIRIEEQKIISDREERETRAQRDIEREERLEHERREENRRRERKEQEQEAERRSRPSRLQRAAKKLEKIIPQMNHEDMDVPIYFRTVEGYFRDVGIEEDLRVAILLPHMNEKARRITSMLSDAQRANYEGVKNTLLQAFKMTPRTYKARFTDAGREPDETWIQFQNRLDCIFTYYLDSRKVTNLEALKDLMVADRLKDVMSYKLRVYILAKEGADWMRPGEVAAAADTYIANVGDPQYTNSRPIHDIETLRSRNNAAREITLRERANRKKYICQYQDGNQESDKAAFSIRRR